MLNWIVWNGTFDILTVYKQNLYLYVKELELFV